MADISNMLADEEDDGDPWEPYLDLGRGLTDDAESTAIVYTDMEGGVDG